MAATGYRAIADALGIGARREFKSPFTLIDMIERGLPLSALDRVCEAIAPEDRSLRYRIVPRATLARMQDAKARLSPEQSDQLARLARVWALALDVWGDTDDAREFLLRKHMLLENRIPLDVALGSEIGGELVEDILGGLQHGTAV